MESEFVKKKRIGEIFLEMGVITDVQLRAGLERQAVVQKRIGEILVDNGLITEDDVAYALAKQFGVQYFDVDSLVLDPDLMQEFDQKLITQEEFLPVRKVDNRLYIAIHDPTDLTVLDQIRVATQLEVRYAVGAESKIKKKFEDFYRDQSGSVAPSPGLQEPVVQPVAAPAPKPIAPPVPEPPPPAAPVSSPLPQAPIYAEAAPAPMEPQPFPSPEFLAVPEQPVQTSRPTADIATEFIDAARSAQVEITFYTRTGGTVKGLVASYDSKAILLIMRQKREIIFWDAVSGASYLLPGA